jgi:hypothetical protein
MARTHARAARRARADWVAARVFARPELWGIIAEHSGYVGAWRLTGVCRASREGANEWLRTPGANGDANVLRLWRELCPELRALWRGDVRTWAGVTFGEGEHGANGAAGRVVKIALLCEGLTGEVPAALGQLAALKELHLGSNRLTGHSYDNMLTGEVPAALGQLAALEHLDLSYNQLTGEVPASLGQLAALEWLDLGPNQLTGEVPAALGQLAALKVLYLGENRLTGEVPPELGQLAALERLDLSYNQLTGEVPAALGQLAALKWLDLQYNRLTGEVPAALGQLAALTKLWLNDNQLGSVPSALMRQLRDRRVEVYVDDASSDSSDDGE